MAYIEDLMQFGLTRQESAIYYALLSEGMMTGYEAAKVSGVSRSNTYTALAALVDKGAAHVAEGTPTHYVPVDPEEFCGSKLEYLKGLSDRLVKEQPRRQREDDAYITISGFQSICQKVVRMLDQAQCRIYMTGTASMLEMFREKLEDHIENGQIGLISDSTHVLTGDLSENDSCSCLYSGKKNLIDLFKQSLSRQIRLIELGQQEKGSNR